MVRCNLILVFCACLSLVASAENGQQRYNERPFESYGEFEVVRGNAEPMPEADSNDNANRKHINPLPKDEPHREFWKKIFDFSKNGDTTRQKLIDALNIGNEYDDKLLKGKQRHYSTRKVKWHFKGKGFDVRDSKYYYYNPMMHVMELNAPDVAIALFKRLYRIDGEPTPTPKGDITWRVVRDDMLKYAMGRGLASVVQELLEVLPIIPSDHSSLFAITYLSYAMGEFNAGKVTLPEVNCDYVIDNFHGACLTLKANAVKYEKHELPFKVLWVQAPKGLLKYAGTIDGDSPARKDLSIYY